MVRVIIALLSTSHCFAAAAAEVDLRDAAALDALQRANPAHYVKIEQVLERARLYPQDGPVQWLPAGLNASDVQYTRSLMKMSYPPKQTLRLRLDDVRYTIDVTRHDLRAP